MFPAVGIYRFNCQFVSKVLQPFSDILQVNSDIVYKILSCLIGLQPLYWFMFLDAHIPIVISFLRIFCTHICSGFAYYLD